MLTPNLKGKPPSHFVKSLALRTSMSCFRRLPLIVTILIFVIIEISIVREKRIVAQMKEIVAAHDTKADTQKEEVTVPGTKSVAQSNELSGSNTATVVSMGVGYGLDRYQSFVGSLRQSNYTGHIIIGVSPTIDKESVRFLKSQSVIIKKLSWANCTYEHFEDEDSPHCAVPYVDIKIRWSRFPLAEDWLRECETCTGPVLITDMRDVYFQSDPFSAGTVVEGLQVFEEHPDLDTTHWLTEWPIRECKNTSYVKPMLCSGTTIGTREAMLEYLDIMHEEMKLWMSDPKCRFKNNGDDQSMHNYLFYSGMLPFAESVPHRTGIVHTVGFEGSVLFKKFEKRCKKKKKDIWHCKFKGADMSKNQWIGLEFNLTDTDGYLTNFDGTRSRVVHQYDRLGPGFIDIWLDEQPIMNVE